MMTGRTNRRVLVLLRKESLQVLRDPSNIAFVLPAVLLILFDCGVSPDSRRVPVGLVLFLGLSRRLLSKRLE